MKLKKPHIEPNGKLSVIKKKYADSNTERSRLMVKPEGFSRL